jgi:type IV pilus modification protein PilV
MTLLPWEKNHCRHKATHGREKRHSGFTLLEVLVSICILAIGILAVGSMQVMSIRGNANANQVTEASVWARDRMETLMAMAYTATSTDPGLTEGTYQDTDSPPGYTIDWEITDGCATGCDTPQDTKLIEVTVAHGNLRKDIVLMDVKPLK